MMYEILRSSLATFPSLTYLTTQLRKSLRILRLL